MNIDLSRVEGVGIGGHFYRCMRGSFRLLNQEGYRDSPLLWPSGSFFFVQGFAEPGNEMIGPLSSIQFLSLAAEKKP